MYEVKDKLEYFTKSNKGKEFINSLVKNGTFEKTTLGEIYNNTELYNILPDLADIKIVHDKNMAIGNAHYNFYNNSIVLGSNSFKIDTYKVIMHELQHAIQYRHRLPLGTDIRNASVLNEVMRYFQYDLKLSKGELDGIYKEILERICL